jgi:hypothetical protein
MLSLAEVSASRSAGAEAFIDVAEVRVDAAE